MTHAIVDLLLSDSDLCSQVRCDKAWPKVLWHSPPGSGLSWWGGKLPDGVLAGPH